MKKIVLIILILVLISGGITFILLKYKKDEVEVKDKDEVNTNIDDSDEEDVYVDDNPIILGLYTKMDGSNYKLVTEYSNVWKRSVDIGVFTVFATNDDIPNGSALGSTWWKYWNTYPNAEDYKIGYNIKYTTSDGITQNRLILSVNDTNLDWGWGELFIYLYDSANQAPGTWYSHITPDKVTEKTKYSTIKLTGHDVTKDFLSPIELTVFTYKSDDDFDPITKLYRGNSSYTIIINQKQS